MKLLQAVLVGVGPFDRLALPFADENGEARPVTVIHGAGGVGKSSVLSAIASTRPGHAVVLPSRPDPREGAAPPFAACDWALGQDEPERPHALFVASPNGRASLNDEAEALRRREQVLFDRLAGEGGYAFLAIPSTRWFSRQPIALSAPARTVARYDVRASVSGDDASRSDLARETKQALAYAAIAAALAPAIPVAKNAEKRFDLLGEAMHSAVDALLHLVGVSYRGLDPLSFEPLFVKDGRVLPFDALPTQVRHLAAFAALSVRTLWAAYPDQDPRESEGVIAIDDVDLHQDAQVQQRLLSALRGALPEAQWILTTASPVLAGAADARSVLALRRLAPEAEGVSEGADNAPRVVVFAGEHARTH
ncbi:MAG: hypothetical protein ABUL62_34120 [Myxococcales bacterium]